MKNKKLSDSLKKWWSNSENKSKRVGKNHPMYGRKIVPWNKGLKKEDHFSLMKVSKALIKLTGKNHPHYGMKRNENFSKKLKDLFKNNPNMGMKGKSHSKETKRKMSEICKLRKEKNGYVNSPKTRENLSKSLKEGYKSGKIKSANKGKKFTEEHKNKMRISASKRIELLGGPCINYNKTACKFFRKINRLYKFNGQYAENKGEYFIKELGYWVDFYSKKYNLVIEWNEERHYDENRLNIKHLRRQEKIKKFLGCSFVNIRQKTFKKENVYRRIENIVRKKTIKLIS